MAQEHRRKEHLAAGRCRERLAVTGLSRGGRVIGVSIDVRIGSLVLGFGLPRVIAFQPDRSHSPVGVDFRAQRPVMGGIK